MAVPLKVASASGVKEDFAPPASGMPGQFPVYLRLPYRRDSYFCFRQETKRNNFLSILSDCIRHQNQGEATEPQLGLFSEEPDLFLQFGL